MKLLIGKMILYFILILVFLEVCVRVFHLYFEYPTYYINELNVKTYLPKQQGYYVTGNRRMKYAKYNINDSGFNSYKEYNPSNTTTDIALIGDSFIEGFHQDYHRSIGKKIETKLKNTVNVFEYGHSGYDLADQLHLIQAYQEHFKNIDYIFIYIKFNNDLKRGKYTPNQWRVDLQYSTTFQIRDKIKLTTYAEGIGVFEPILRLRDRFFGIVPETYEDEAVSEADAKKYLDNLKTLIDTFGFDKTKTTFLLDKDKTSTYFLDYCDKMGYNYIDFSKAFKQSEKPTTLIYDMHWNNHGRALIANSIVDYLNKKISN
ncbi:hypothetical protein [Hwangdonia sp.]|uniref:hypothetical protein n=1 Tax=Hwangdonia sp. TaxID=1883432 RepID=UPI003AB46FCB